MVTKLSSKLYVVGDTDSGELCLSEDGNNQHISSKSGAKRRAKEYAINGAKRDDPVWVFKLVPICKYLSGSGKKVKIED